MCHADRSRVIFRKPTLIRSASVKLRDNSLFRRSLINSITVFGSINAVEDMSDKDQQRTPVNLYKNVKDSHMHIKYTTNFQ